MTKKMINKIYLIILNNIIVLFLNILPCYNEYIFRNYKEKIILFFI